jgi:hypothetical protein
MDTTFSIFETVAEVKFSFVLDSDFSGTEVMSFPEFSFFPKLTLVSIEQIAVLVVFGEKKCSFKSMLRFAVVEFEDIDVTPS